MNPTSVNIIKEWLQFSKDDLYVAEHFFETMEFPIYKVVCFNALQAVEKYLKAYQIYFDIDIIKTHDLIKLVNSLLVYDENFIKLSEDLKSLTYYSVKFSYPDDFVDLTKENAEHSILIAKQIQQHITTRIQIN